MLTMSIPTVVSLLGAAEHFSSMLSSRMPVSESIARPCALRISAGLHRGALMRLQSPTSLGCGPENDVVLSDPEVLDKHAQLRRVDSVWVLVKGADGAIIMPFETLNSGRFVRSHYAIGTAQITVTQVGKAKLKKVTYKNKTSSKFIAIVLLLSAAMLGAVVVVQLVRPVSANIIKGVRNLAVEGWADVELVDGGNSRVLARGYVKDADAMKRLLVWLKKNDLESVSMTVRIGVDLAARVKEALAENTLSVVYMGSGTVRVSGASENLATRERLSRIKVDLASVVNIDDQVIFTQTADVKPREHLLPIRISDVRPGFDALTGSFSADNNTRYFVGAVLPDGSEVLSIKADGIEFALGNKIITYPLK